MRRPGMGSLALATALTGTTLASAVGTGTGGNTLGARAGLPVSIALTGMGVIFNVTAAAGLAASAAGFVSAVFTGADTGVLDATTSVGLLTSAVFATGSAAGAAATGLVSAVFTGADTG